MIRCNVFKTAGVDPGDKLPAYAWPGGYPLVYYTPDGSDVCPDCANGGNGSCFRDPDTDDDPDWTIDGVEVYWEGSDLLCCHCNGTIESAYGDPNADEGEA